MLRSLEDLKGDTQQGGHGRSVEYRAEENLGRPRHSCLPRTVKGSGPGKILDEARGVIAAKTQLKILESSCEQLVSNSSMYEGRSS
jgi:hypothetical protein